MPRKAYKRAPGRSVGMPEVTTAQNFNRRITADEVAILTAAGFGSKTSGFRNLLDLYQELHNMGFRFGQPICEFFYDKSKPSEITKSLLKKVQENKL
jgi:hypothetical protein